MDILKHDGSDEEFHDCLDDISDANKVPELKILNLEEKYCNESDQMEKHTSHKRTNPSAEETAAALEGEIGEVVRKSTDKPPNEDDKSESCGEIKKQISADNKCDEQSENEEHKSEFDPCATNHDNNKQESSSESEDEGCLAESQIEERTVEAKTLKDEGNVAYRNENFEEAVRLYSEGIKVCPKHSYKDRAILFSNRSACYMQTDHTDDAIKDCSSAISLHPQYVKAYLRRAQLYDKTEKYEEATKDYEKILELDPSMHSARQALMTMPGKIEIRNEKLKAQMMTSLKDLGNLFLRPFGLSTDNFQMQQNPDTGSYNIQFNNNPGTRNGTVPQSGR